MANANDLRKGNAINKDGDIHIVLDMERVKPGKGGAYVQAALRNLRTGKSSQTRFSSTESVDIIPLIRKKLEYSYRDGTEYVFLDTETFDQVHVPGELVEPVLGYLVEGTAYDLIFSEGQPLQLELPASVNLTVVESPEWVKGDSATNVRKPVKLETGLEALVPLFIKAGEVIKIDPRTGEYLSRAKDADGTD